MFTIEEILELAIKIEKNGEAVYLMAIEKWGNSSLSSLLEWMADDEVRHARWFENFRNDVMQNRRLAQDMENTQGLQTPQEMKTLISGILQVGTMKPVVGIQVWERELCI